MILESVWEWVINLPRHMAEFSSWLSTPFKIGSAEFTPLAIFGAGFGVFMGIVLVLKIKNLIL